MNNRFQYSFEEFIRNNRGGRIGAHASGIRASVAVEHTFVVLAQSKRNDSFAVCDYNYGCLFSDKAFLYNYFISGGPEYSINHDSFYGGLCLMSGITNNNAFSGAKSVRLYYDRRLFGLEIFQSAVALSKHPKVRCGDIQPFHQLFREDFAALQYCPFLNRAEYR